MRRKDPKQKVGESVELDAKVARQALEYLFAARYISKKRLYFENFIRGMFFSIGSIVGIAVTATLILWVLSLFNSFPFIQQIYDAVEQSLQ